LLEDSFDEVVVLTSNNIEVSKLENVNWQQYFHNPRRVAHEIQGMEPVPIELDENTKTTIQENQLEKQKRLRLRVMACMAREIYSINELMER